MDSDYLFQFQFSGRELESSLDQIARTLHAERVLICYQSNPDEELELAAQRGFPPDLAFGDFDISQGTVAKVFQTGDARALFLLPGEPIDHTQSMTEARLLSVMCAPVEHDGVVFGIIYADNKRRTGPFESHHKDWFIEFGKALGSRARIEKVHIARDESEGLPPREDIWKRLRGKAHRARHMGNLGTAQKYLSRALSYCRFRDLGRSELSQNLNDLAEICRLRGDVTKAESLIDECLEVATQSPPLPVPVIVPYFNNRAGLFYAKGNVEEAERVYCEVLDLLYQGNSAALSSRAVPVLCNLGTLCQRRGQQDRAAAYLSKAVELAKSLWGADDPVTSQCQRKLDECLSAQEKAAS